MRFTLVDRLVEITSGKKIVAVKSLSLAEEYLADHFPLFPVMPGVLMLEAMTQTAAWLIRDQEDFAHSLVLLKEARNVKYSDFVEPGELLIVQAELIKENDRETTFKAQGHVDGKLCVSARLVLERYNLAEANPDDAPQDRFAIESARELFAILKGPEAVAASKEPALTTS